MVKLQCQCNFHLVVVVGRILHLLTSAFIILIIMAAIKPISAGILTDRRPNFTQSKKILSNRRQRFATPAGAAVIAKPQWRQAERLTEQVEIWKRLYPGEELPEQYISTKTMELEETEEIENDDEESDQEEKEEEEAHIEEEKEVEEEKEKEYKEEHEEEEVHIGEPENENEEAIEKVEDESKESLLEVWFKNTLDHAIELFYIDAETGEKYSAATDVPAIVGPGQSMGFFSLHDHAFRAYRVGDELLGQPLKVFHVDAFSRGEEHGKVYLNMEL